VAIMDYTALAPMALMGAIGTVVPPACAGGWKTAAASRLCKVGTLIENDFHFQLTGHRS